MCTVTFIPASDRIYLTSNRDEKHWRADALAPAVHRHGNGQVLFPRDAHAGGTWIAAHENGNAMVFLNGGWIKHEPAPPYRKSRGLVLLDLIGESSPYQAFMMADLDNIEPFTAIIWDEGSLYECRWDGSRKYTREKDEARPHIWSSVTLYDEPVIQKRADWFDQWLKQNPHPGLQAIEHFHQFTGDGDAHNDLRMNRDGMVYTVSVTSLAISRTDASMHYIDLKNGSHWLKQLAFEKNILSR